MSDSNPKPKVVFGDPLQLFPMAMTKLYSLWISATYPFASRGQNLSIHWTTGLSRRAAPRIKLGSSVIIRKGAWFNIPSEASGELNIIIDDNCCVAAWNIISAKNCIHLEHDVILAPSVLIMDHEHELQDVSWLIRDQGGTEGGRIRIGQGCWIGHAAAIICTQGELVLGRNCIVAANAVVTGSAPPYSVLAGNPARVVKQFDPVKRAWVMGSVRLTETKPAK